MVFGEVDISLQIHSYILMQVMKLNSVEDPFDILKRHFHPYNILSSGGPRNDKMVAESQATRAHWFSKHMLLQSMISLKPKIQMKNREIPF